ncbi:hypothetical protein CCR75_005218 [Bremia lactucae]|uniref:Uncharacterized protein n=1 Tax=Bremia lactucae TaxID=4779 RepID=A0A976IBS2_BRELC|nr:hypothetical protein CCR75_005218 [Bremia lactucae]
MVSFSECEEQKERVKACYGGWFQKLWGGSIDRHKCEQETEDYRNCVQDAMRSRKEEGKRKLNLDDDDWMDQIKDKTNDAADEAKSRARNARNRVYDEKENAKSNLRSKASDVTSKVQETAESWVDSVKGYTKKADNKARKYADDHK